MFLYTNSWPTSMHSRFAGGLKVVVPDQLTAPGKHRDMSHASHAVQGHQLAYGHADP